MKKIALILSGCGVYDGSEIHETVACLFSLQKANLHVQCLAPNILQTRVVNHVTKELMNEQRNLLVESARIARGNIKDISQASIDDFDAAVYPGGFGAACQLSNFSSKGVDSVVQKDVLHFASEMAKKSKPQAFVCIAPSLISKIYGPGVKMTIGNDKETIAVLKKMGNIHQEAKVTEFVFDEKHKVLSTPAYMLAQNVTEVFEGVDNMIQKLKSLLDSSNSG